jgi:hypothetical protein
MDPSSRLISDIERAASQVQTAGAHSAIKAAACRLHVNLCPCTCSEARIAEAKALKAQLIKEGQHQEEQLRSLHAQAQVCRPMPMQHAGAGALCVLCSFPCRLHSRLLPVRPPPARQTP